MDSNSNLNFINENPGAVKYGNFINYYEFNPPEKRINLLPKDVWKKCNLTQNIVALDIGCNTGELTNELYNLISSETNCDASILGVDIDETLIVRANENNNATNITYKCLDFMNVNDRTKILKEYLRNSNKDVFDIIFCFSTTMWIHLNHGDDGLKDFLTMLSQFSKQLVVEPQPWKCYKSALKRVKNDKTIFPEYNNLKIRNDVDNFIEDYLLNDCNMKLLYKSEKSNWGRNTLIYTN